MTKGRGIAVTLAGAMCFGFVVVSSIERPGPGTGAGPIADLLLILLAIGLLCRSALCAAVGVWVFGVLALRSETHASGYGPWCFGSWALLLWSRSEDVSDRPPVCLGPGLRAFLIATHLVPVLFLAIVAYDSLSFGRTPAWIPVGIVTAVFWGSLHRLRRNIAYPRPGAIAITALLCVGCVVTFLTASLGMLLEPSYEGASSKVGAIACLGIAGVFAWMLRDALRFDKRMQTSYP